MSYRTNALGRRLSYKTLWVSPAYFKHPKDFLVDFRLKAFIRSVFNTTIKPAAKNRHTKTKTVLGYRPKSHPVIMGEIQILRKVSSIFFVINYFLMEEGVHSRRFTKLEFKILKGKIFLEKILQKKIHLLFNNYYHYVLNAMVFVHPKKYIRILAQKLLLKNFSKIFGIRFQNLYANLGYFMQIFEKRFSRYRRNNYFERIFFPIISLFYMKKFDVTLLAKVIALELQTLRKFHVPFLEFVHKLLKAFFKSLNKNKLLGIQIFVKGRMTFYRRQVRRKQKKIYNVGFIKRSCIEANTTSSSEISYNRYGIMNVLVTVHEKKQEKLLTATDLNNSNLDRTSSMDFFWNFFNEEEINNDENFEYLLKTKEDLNSQFCNPVRLKKSSEIKKESSLMYRLNSFYKNNAYRHFCLFRYRFGKTLIKYTDISTTFGYNYSAFIKNTTERFKSLIKQKEKNWDKLPYFEKKQNLSTHSLVLYESLLFKKQKKNYSRWFATNKKKFSNGMSILLKSWKFKDHKKRVRIANLINDKFIEVIYRPSAHLPPLLPLVEKPKILSFLVGLKRTLFINKLFILRNKNKRESVIQTYPKTFIFVHFLQVKFLNFFLFVFFLFKLVFFNFSLNFYKIFDTLSNKSFCFDESTFVFAKNSKINFNRRNPQPGQEFLIKKEYKSLFYFFLLKQNFNSFSLINNFSRIKNYKFLDIINKRFLFNNTESKIVNRRFSKNKFWKSVLKKYLNKKGLSFKKEPAIFLFRTTFSLAKRKLKKLFFYRLFKIRKRIKKRLLLRKPKLQRKRLLKRKNELRSKK